ncbi:hypothetical protein WDW86_08310 [Bdellovibrionota bacterium FG-2]
MTWLASPDENPQNLIRGVSTYHLPASQGRRLGALIVDGILAIAVGVAALTLGESLGGFTGIPKFSWILTFILIFFGVRRASPGRRIWGLKKTNGQFQKSESLGFVILFRGGATLLSGLVLLALTQFTLLAHPLWQKAQPWQPHLSREGAANAQNLPFFYTQALWPLSFGNQPIYYSIPYEKGPPAHFVGHIVARWDAPGAPRIRVIFEGPKTPNAPWPLEALKDCFAKSWISLLDLKDVSQDLSCLTKKQDVLARHLGEIRALGMKVTEFRWFNLPSQAQGFYLHSEKPKGYGYEETYQDRFCFITPHGIHQTVILERPHSADGATAWQTFQAALSTLELREALKTSQAWVNDQLAKINAKNSQVEVLTHAQALLASKISVDGKVLDSYFHLGGTAYLQLQKNESAPRDVMNNLIANMYHYSKDLAPLDPRTLELEKMVLAAEKIR